MQSVVCCDVWDGLRAARSAIGRFRKRNVECDGQRLFFHYSRARAQRCSSDRNRRLAAVLIVIASNILPHPAFRLKEDHISQHEL
jgi:hypothetical protein